MLKKKPIFEEYQFVLTLIFKNFTQRLQTPSVTFDDMLDCLRFSGRVEFLNFEKGLTDGFALQVMQEILTRLIHIPNRNTFITLNKFLKKFASLIPNCIPVRWGKQIFNRRRNGENQHIIKSTISQAIKVWRCMLRFKKKNGWFFWKRFCATRHQFYELNLCSASQPSR